MKYSAEILLYLLFDLAIIIAAARLCGALFRRIGQPVVIGEILQRVPARVNRDSQGAPKERV